MEKKCQRLGRLDGFRRGFNDSEIINLYEKAEEIVDKTLYFVCRRMICVLAHVVALINLSHSSS